MIAKIIVTGADPRQRPLPNSDTALAATAIDGTETNLPHTYAPIASSRPPSSPAPSPPAFLATFNRHRATPSKSSKAAPRPPSRTTPAASASGTSASRPVRPHGPPLLPHRQPPRRQRRRMHYRDRVRHHGRPPQASHADTLIAITGRGHERQASTASPDPPLDRHRSHRIRQHPLPRRRLERGHPRLSSPSAGAASTPSPISAAAATFMLGRFGGPAGRALRSGDVLHLGQPDLALETPAALPTELVPRNSRPTGTIGVLFGPPHRPPTSSPKPI